MYSWVSLVSLYFAAIVWRMNAFLSTLELYMMSHKSSRAQQTLLHATAADNAYSEMPCKERYVNRTGRLHKKNGIKWGLTNFLLYIAICKRVWSLGHGSNNDHHRLTLRYGFFKVLEEAYLGRVPWQGCELCDQSTARSCMIRVIPRTYSFWLLRQMLSYISRKNFQQRWAFLVTGNTASFQKLD